MFQYFIIFKSHNYEKGKESTHAKAKKIAEVMHEFKEGELHSGKSNVIVTNPKQAIAIAFSEAGGVKEENSQKKDEK